MGTVRSAPGAHHNRIEASEQYAAFPPGQSPTRQNGGQARSLFYGMLTAPDQLDVIETDCAGAAAAGPSAQQESNLDRVGPTGSQAQCRPNSDGLEAAGTRSGSSLAQRVLQARLRARKRCVNWELGAEPHWGPSGELILLNQESISDF